MQKHELAGMLTGICIVILGVSGALYLLKDPISEVKNIETKVIEKHPYKLRVQERVSPGYTFKRKSESMATFIIEDTKVTESIDREVHKKIDKGDSVSVRYTVSESGFIRIIEVNPSR